MIITKCAWCAKQLEHKAPRCGNCKTRYCSRECQKQHWKKGDHKTLCPLIKRGGGAEQYHADTRYTEAVGVAAEACAEDTAGQTCYICTQALHWKTKEGLVRGCSCRGTAGFAHVSCLAEQAKILVAEAKENNLGFKVLSERWARWDHCSMCKQEYHGVVRCALGWACWKTYLGRLEEDWSRVSAMRQLGNGLSGVGQHEDALSVREAELSTCRRLRAGQEDTLVAQNNLATTYQVLGRLDEGLRMRQEVYSGRLKLNGEEHEETLRVANNYAVSLNGLKRFDEAKSLMRKTVPVARRVLGENHDLTLRMRKIYSKALYKDPDATLDDLREAVATLEDIEPIARRVLGGAHPLAASIERDLQNARAAFDASEKA